MSAAAVGAARGGWLDHVLILIVAVAVLAASALLTPSDDVVTLFGWQVPELCTVRRLFGVRCPGCGLTRSFAYMGHGDVVAAFRLHVLGPLLFGLVAAQVPYRLVKVWRSRLPAPGPGAIE